MSEEMKLTPDIEDWIRREAARGGINPELLRYFYQFGVDAPSWPQPSRKARRWLRRLRRIG